MCANIGVYCRIAQGFCDFSDIKRHLSPQNLHGAWRTGAYPQNLSPPRHPQKPCIRQRYRGIRLTEAFQSYHIILKHFVSQLRNRMFHSHGTKCFIPAKQSVSYLRNKVFRDWRTHWRMPTLSATGTKTTTHKLINL